MPRILVIDNHDSFTFNLVQYLLELGATCETVTHHEMDAAAAKRRDPDGILISPGPGTPVDAGVSLDLIAALGPHIPILGVCLGHQCIGAAMGAAITRAKRLMHGKTSPIFHTGAGVFAGLPSPFTATRYHSLVIHPGTLPPGLEITAASACGEIMGVRHRHWPLEGVQFHPEAILTEHGHALLRNWLARLNGPVNLERVRGAVC